MCVGHEFVCHATVPEAVIRPVDIVAEGAKTVMLIRPKEQEKLVAVRRALWSLTIAAENYDVKSLFWWKIPWQWLRGQRNWLSTKNPVCSELVARAFRMNTDKGQDVYPFDSIPVENIVPGDFEPFPFFKIVGEWKHANYAA